MLEKTVLSLSYGRIVVKPPEKLHGLVPASFETYQVVEPGDIVCRPTDLQNDWNSLRFGFAATRGIITSAYMNLGTKRGILPQYGYALLNTYDLLKVFYGLGSGLRQNLDWSDFKYLPCLGPSPPEQSAIVRYLDHVDRRIRKYIRAKQKLIGLLNEQKQAIIHKAVTRGLDPNVKLKPSGVPWLGDVPEHWEVRKLKYLGEVRIGLTYHPAEVSDEQGTLVLRASNIRDGRIVSADNVYVSKAVPEALLVAEGDILICVRSGSRSLVGKSAVITSEFRGVTYGAFMSLLRSRLNRFIWWALNSNMLPCIMAQFETSTINQLTQNDLRNLSIPFPPTAERAAIAAHLTSESTTLDTAAITARRQIDLAREYRARIVADVVTGKLDVREAAANLPEEAEDIEESEVETGSDEAEAEEAGAVMEAGEDES
ncbi:restriction endonuclease subunit S [candidate division WOR-3 bacterium]|nr:restriction endonuclease subunit S [candidate division WOR-3 bacterium]